jgi:hypothetical protein
MRSIVDGLKSLANRRLFMKKGLAAAGTASLAIARGWSVRDWTAFLGSG